MGKIINKIKSWFMSRKKMADAYLSILEKYDKLAGIRAERLAKLDQNSIYALIVEDMTEKNTWEVRELWEQAGKKLKWTPPKLLIIDKKLYGVICHGATQTTKNGKERTVEVVALSEEAGEYEGGFSSGRELREHP